MIRKRLYILAACYLAASFMAGCSLAPGYKRPDSPVASSWPEGDAYRNNGAAKTGNEAADMKWQDFFVSQPLKKIIELALANNRDLRIAALNIERARALYQIQRAELFPTVKASGTGNIQRIPADLSSSGKSVFSEQYSVNAGFSSYELDFFGRVQSLRDKALEQYLSTEQARTSTRISLVAEIAGAYLTLAADRERLKLAKDTYNAQKSTHDMIKRRFEVGASSELDLRQVQTRVDAARVDIARYTGKAAQDENALVMLVGSSVPGHLMPSELGKIEAMRDIKPGLPSAVLLKRPDILQAENQLKAANANIGAARAAFFPKISLTGSFGTSSEELSGLFKGGSAAWSFMPQISIPVFDAGTNQANLEVAETDSKIALAKYEKAIQTAFREVADALAQRGTVDDQMTAQKSFLEATSESFRLSDARYISGIDSYLNVLDAQRSLYSARQAMIDVRLLKFANMVNMYKVLGGGMSE